MAGGSFRLAGPVGLALQNTSPVAALFGEHGHKM
jgi:hypothetical protein